MNSYNHLRSQNIIENDHNPTDDKFFQMIAAGRADLKLIVWKQMQNKELLQDTDE